MSAPTPESALIELARVARLNAYAPYSRFKVGAAVRASDGACFSGCNIENAAYGPSLCAERCALASLVATGRRRWTEVCVFTDTERPTPPCGTCRQVLHEFADDAATVVLATPSAVERFTLAELFPHAFELRRDGE